MLRDARDTPAETVLETGVCVVGSGPAGLTLAREFAGRGVQVLVLESGGLEYDQRAKDLAGGETEGDFFKPLCTSRVRQFGGTANMWDTQIADAQLGFRGAPLDGVDLEPRDWLPHYVGWPFGREELDPYYERAHAVGRFGPFDYDLARWERPECPRLPLDSDILRTTFWQFGAREAMIDESREAVERAGNITVLLNATVVEIETTESASAVTRLRVAKPDGARFSVAAKQFVLAMGGIDNARLLLLSDAVQPTGLGNRHDLVGRYFMEHQQVRCGELVPARRDLFGRLGLYDERVVDGVPVMGQIQFTDEALRRERLLNLSAALVPRRRRFDRPLDQAVQSFEMLVGGAMRGRLPENAGQHVRTVVDRIDYVAAAAARRLSGGRLFKDFLPAPDFVRLAGWSERPETHRDFQVFEVLLHVEQTPDPENRITLGRERDVYGCRFPTLHWEWRERDIDSVRRAQRLLAREMARAGLGRLRIASEGGRPKLIFPGLHHHMGTTRMHPDPKQGVVNEHGRVHGVANLYVAGCSVFPTGGFINPTLTIIALAIRLADHLKDAAAPAARANAAAGTAAEYDVEQ